MANDVGFEPSNGQAKKNGGATAPPFRYLSMKTVSGRLLLPARHRCRTCQPAAEQH